jgi:hypothetical protein
MARRCGAFAGKAVGVHLGLQLAPARIERGAVQALLRQQAEQREVVVGELHGRRNSGTHSALPRNSDKPLSG